MAAQVNVHHAEALAWLRDQPDATYDGVLCDPPYSLGFMGKAWDMALPSVELWTEVLRVCKPGAPLLAFGGSRTFHRLTCAIEDAGYEIRDVLMYLYGSGFPKSLDVSKAIDRAEGETRKVIGADPFASRRVSKNVGALGLKVGAPGHTVTAPTAVQWDGYGTALKPAFEPILLARKPLDGTVAANVAKHGVGGIAIDACRIGRAVDDVSGWSETGSSSSENVAMTGANYARDAKPDADGRWPANLLLDEHAAQALDAQSGERAGGRPVPAVTSSRPIWGGADRQPFDGYNDSGGASRFFYVAKTSTAEREFGCEDLPFRTPGETCDREDGSAGLDSPRAGAGAGRVGGTRNIHPTLKPISLTQWLATLILPPPRTDGAPRRLLVPFAGAGSEAIGAMRAGWDVIDAVEREEEYVAILRARVARWREVPPRLSVAEVVGAGEDEDPKQTRMFG